MDLLCRCDEADQWSKRDKHADAYNVLTGARGKRMAKALGYDVTEPRGKGKACLVCHAVVIDDDKVQKASDASQFNIKEGVNCVVCHGPHVEWVASHGLALFAGKFRPLSRQVKEDEYGMRNLWSPVKRAELCSSCHIGNLEQGKFITHDMYAAGHPPLPGFEVATFSNEMPRHWQYLREKTPAVQKELGLRKGEQEETQLLLVGAAVGFRDTMRLLERQAKKATSERTVLDLANFDCYACHHDLKSPSWRQKRGYKGTPGRVPMRPWSTELVQMAIGESDDEKLAGQFPAGMKAVTAAFDARPYGDPAAIEKSAHTMAGWADQLVKRLGTTHADRADARRLLAAAPGFYSRALLYYDSARQVAWSLEIFFNELNGPRDGNAKVRKMLGNLDTALKLRLPQGRAKLIEDELEENLRKLNGYDPDVFRSALRSLGAALAGGK
jgi:hypothetical protein